MLADDLLRGASAAAAFIGIDRRSVYDLVEAGQIPAIRKGGRWYFRKSEIEHSFSSDTATGGSTR